MKKIPLCLCLFVLNPIIILCALRVSVFRIYMNLENNLNKGGETLLFHKQSLYLFILLELQTVVPFGYWQQLCGYKGVNYTLCVLTHWNLDNFICQSRNKVVVDAPYMVWWYVMPFVCLDGRRSVLPCQDAGEGVLYIHIRWGFALLVSTDRAVQSLNEWNERLDASSALFMSTWLFNLLEQ